MIFGFMATWCLTAVYLASGLALALRIRTLRARGKVPEGTPDFLNPSEQSRAVTYLFRPDHRELHDRLASTLVLVCRALFIVLLPAFLFFFIRVGFWHSL